MPFDPFGDDGGDPFGGGGEEADPFAPGQFGVEDEFEFGGGFAGLGGAAPEADTFYTRRLPITEEQLTEIITELIEPAGWAGDKGIFIKAAHGRIVVRHTNAVHEKIHELAKRLRIKQFRELDPPDDGFTGGFTGGFGGGFF